MGYFDFWQWLALLQHELLLFAGVFFLLGAVDDILIDLVWVWLKLTGKAKTSTLNRTYYSARDLNGPVAVFVPAWGEASVIGDTIRHALSVWKHSDLRFYVGCYGNDPQTIAAAIGAATVLVQQGDNRLRIVIHDHQGPSTKADCLNRLYRALLDDERRSKGRFTCVVFHDAEDMVDPAGLSLLDQEIAAGADFVQLPVEPLVQKSSRWLGSHYCEEFAEAHAKSMVVRSWLGAPLPGAGVGCAISRRALHQLSREHPDGAPFDAQSLTEDYELGLLVAERGGTSRFARAFGEDGSLVATRAYFPSRLDHVVRQKTRWVHGIALQGWDRLGWTRTFADTWMRARDRRGPFAAFVLLMGYALFAVTLILWLGAAFGVAPILALTPALKALVAINLAALFWRSAFRFGFTAQAYGFVEGLRAVLRIPVSNVVSIMAGHRAIKAYAATLLGASIVWDKTPHFRHPANAKALLPPFRRESRSKLTRAEG